MRVLCTSEALDSASPEIDLVQGGDLPIAVGYSLGLVAGTGAVGYAIGAGVAVTVATGGLALVVYTAAFGLTYAAVKVMTR